MANHPHRSRPMPDLLTLVDSDNCKLVVSGGLGNLVLELTEPRRPADSILILLNTEQAKMLRARIAKFLRENA